MTTRKIIITGGRGIIAQALTKTLKAAGYDTKSLTRTSTNGPEIPGLIPVDYQNIPQLENTLKGADLVIHCAGAAHETATSLELDSFRKANVDTTKNLATVSRHTSIKHFVYLSSIKAMGESTDAHPFTADSPARPTTDYGISKHEAEIALADILSKDESVVHGVSWTILRLPLVLSPQASGNAALLKKLIRRGLPLPFGSVRNRRSVLLLDDLCTYFQRLCASPPSSNQTLLPYSATLSTAEMTKLIGQWAQRSPRIISLPENILKRTAALLGRREMAEKLFGNLEIQGPTIDQLSATHDINT